MKQKINSIKKVTNFKWLNIFNIIYTNSKGNIVNWDFVSRKNNPLKNDKADAVVIIPIIETKEGKNAVIIKEYRATIMDYEYGFPAGLIEEDLSIEETVKKELKEETGLNVKKIINISNKVYSSPGLSDESCVMVFVEAEGSFSAKYQEPSEDIEIILMGIKEINNLLKDKNKKVGAKAWGILYYYSKIGEIK